MLNLLLSMFSSCSCEVPSSPEIDHVRGGSKRTKYRRNKTSQYKTDENIVKMQLIVQNSLSTSQSTFSREKKVDRLIDPHRSYTSTESREIVEKLRRVLNEEN